MLERLHVITVVVLLAIMLLPVVTSASAEARVKVTYERSDEIFVNPERGFYTWTEATVPAPGAGITGNLVTSVLKSTRFFNDGHSLIIRNYNLHGFRDLELTDTALDFIRTDFERLRESGMKAIVRFRYTTAIGDPDAPLEIVLRHIEQLKPLFQEYYDVIAVLNAGFIGAWGEWHASTHNLTDVENQRAILFALLDALPKERMVQIRYPIAKMHIFNTDQPITRAQAYDGSYIARTAHHNDCFLASETDVGTYKFSIQAEKEYLHHETRYLAFGGETCTSRGNDRFASELALKEMEYLHLSFLNSNYYKGALDTWRQEGTMPEIMKRMGYRFVLLSGEYSQSAAKGGTITVDLHLENEGFAAPFNPRGLELVMRNVTTGDVYVAPLPSDPRFWHPGEDIHVHATIGLPQDIAAGDYELLLHLPDPTETLYGRPEYSIRLANVDVWEAQTGYNRLGVTVSVTDETAAVENDSVDSIMEKRS